MPVYNEERTVERAMDALLAADISLSVGAAGRRRRLDRRNGELPARTRVAGQVRALLSTTATAARAPRCARRSPRPAAVTRPCMDADLEYSPADLPAARAIAQRRRRSGLRDARLSGALRIQLLVRDRQSRSHVRGEPDLQQLGLGHHDRAQGDADRALSLARAPRARLRDRGGDHRAASSTRLRHLRGPGHIPRARRARRARSSRPSTGCA